MKKLLAIILTVVMVMSFGVTALAAGSFVDSPSGYKEPEIVDVEKDDDCEMDIVITPYGDKDELDDEGKEDMQEAYDDINSTDDLTDLCEDLKDAAEDAGVDPDSLVVSELFDVSVEGCTDHTQHGDMVVTIKPTTIENMVALMTYQDGTWQLVNGFKVDKATGYLTFTANKFGPYAIVLSKNATSPKTADTAPFAASVVALVSLVGIAVLAKSKKNEA